MDCLPSATEHWIHRSHAAPEEDQKAEHHVRLAQGVEQCRHDTLHQNASQYISVVRQFWINAIYAKV